jgi:hypothetical protein
MVVRTYMLTVVIEREIEAFFNCSALDSSAFISMRMRYRFFPQLSLRRSSARLSEPNSRFSLVFFLHLVEVLEKFTSVREAIRLLPSLVSI